MLVLMFLNMTFLKVSNHIKDFTFIYKSCNICIEISSFLCYDFHYINQDKYSKWICDFEGFKDDVFADWMGWDPNCTSLASNRHAYQGTANSLFYWMLHTAALREPTSQA